MTQDAEQSTICGGVEIDRTTGPLGEEVGYRANGVFLSDGDDPTSRRLYIGRTTVHRLTDEELDGLETIIMARRAQRAGSGHE